MCSAAPRQTAQSTVFPRAVDAKSFSARARSVASAQKFPLLCTPCHGEKAELSRRPSSRTGTASHVVRLFQHASRRGCPRGVASSVITRQRPSRHPTIHQRHETCSSVSGWSLGAALHLLPAVIDERHLRRPRRQPRSESVCYERSDSAAYVLTRDSANDITITQMFITLAIMLEVY